MTKEEIKSKEDYINLYADKIWDRESLVNPKTGRFYDRLTPLLISYHDGNV